MTSCDTETSLSLGPVKGYPPNPWKSLNFYTEQDRDTFYGRKAETEEMLRLLQRDLLTIVFGRSGLGKTSLLRAGVMPRLREEGFLPVIKRVVYSPGAPTPTAQVKEELVAAAATAGVDIEEITPALRAEGRDDAEETLWELLHRCRFWGPRNDPVMPVLILDQFEEVFTYGRQNSNTKDFLDQLGDVVENRIPTVLKNATEETGTRLQYDTRASQYRVILSLREDFVPKLDSLRPSIPSVMRNRFQLLALKRQQAVEVVLSGGSKWIDDKVANNIVRIVAGENRGAELDPRVILQEGGIEPAYLSVMCFELYERMKEKGRKNIDEDLVTQEHGNILDTMYERSFEGTDPQTRIFVEDLMVTPGGYRGTIPLAEAEQKGVSTNDLKTLVDRRILRYEERLGTTHVELCHDRLTDIVKKSRNLREAAVQREAERHRQEAFTEQLHRMRLHACLAASSVALLAVGIVFYYFGWIYPHDTYCRDFTKRWGAIHPVGGIQKSAVAHRTWTLKLTSEGWFGKIISAEVIDGYGRPTPDHPISTYFTADSYEEGGQEKPTKFQFIYGPDKTVVYEVSRDRLGRRSWTFIHVPSDQEKKKQTKGIFVNAEGFPRAFRHSRAEVVEITYDRHGFESKRMYKDRRGNPITGPDDAFGVSVTYDAKGRALRTTSLNEKEQPMIDTAGNASMQLEYDRDENTVAGHAFDAKGERTLVKDGWATTRLSYDNWGRQKDQRFFGLSGEPVAEANTGAVHRETFEYDDHGKLKSMKLYGVNGDPVEAQEESFSFPAHEKRMTYNADGRLESISYFGRDGNNLTSTDGWHRQVFQYDEKGFLRSFTLYDGSGALAKTGDGVSRYEYKNDEYGRALETRNYGPSSAPTAGTGGHHLVRKRYDSAGNVVEEAYFDHRHRPVREAYSGVHCIKSFFDPFGNCRRREFFDEAQHPRNCRDGFQTEIKEYDRFGSVTAMRWLNKDNKPCSGPEGVQYIKRDYDPTTGLIVRETRYTADNRPARGGDGIHQIIYRHNDKRLETMRQYLGLEGQKAEDAKGNHLIVTGYDDRGRQIVVRQVRANGTGNLFPALRIAVEKKVYNKKNEWTEQAYYDSSGHLSIGPSGYAKCVVVYRSDGGMEIYNVGPDGKLMFNRMYGCAAKKVELSLPHHRESYLGPDRNLITGPPGYSERIWQEDAKGNYISAAWFGPDGRPVSGPWGVHAYKRTADGGKKYYDIEKREIPAPGLYDAAPVIFILEIQGLDTQAAQLKLRPGDMFWRYGRWSMLDIWAAARAKGIVEPQQVQAEALQALVQEIRERGREQVTAVMVRDGKPFKVVVPPLLKGRLGTQLNVRLIPLKEWDSIGRHLFQGAW